MTLAISRQRDGVGAALREQSLHDGSFEEGVAVQDHELPAHLVAHEPAGAEVVAVLEEGIELGTHLQSVEIESGHDVFHHVCRVTGGDHDLFNVATADLPELPFEQWAAIDGERALGSGLGEGQQSAALTCAQDDHFHGIETRLSYS